MTYSNRFEQFFMRDFVKLGKMRNYAWKQQKNSFMQSSLPVT